jgi:hypothetical protein
MIVRSETQISQVRECERMGRAFCTICVSMWVTLLQTVVDGCIVSYECLYHAATGPAEVMNSSSCVDRRCWETTGQANHSGIETGACLAR